MTFSLNRAVEAFPRHFVIEGPAPLTRLKQFSEHCDIDLWIKPETALKRVVSSEK